MIKTATSLILVLLAHHHETSYGICRMMSGRVRVQPRKFLPGRTYIDLRTPPQKAEEAYPWLDVKYKADLIRIQKKNPDARIRIFHFKNAPLSNHAVIIDYNNGEELIATDKRVCSIIKRPNPSGTNVDEMIKYLNMELFKGEELVF